MQADSTHRADSLERERLSRQKKSQPKTNKPTHSSKENPIESKIKPKKKGTDNIPSEPEYAPKRGIISKAVDEYGDDFEF